MSKTNQRDQKKKKNKKTTDMSLTIDIGDFLDTSEKALL